MTRNSQGKFNPREDNKLSVGWEQTTVGPDLVSRSSPDYRRESQVVVIGNRNRVQLKFTTLRHKLVRVRFPIFRRLRSTPFPLGIAWRVHLKVAPVKVCTTVITHTS
ncbi:hypothetical protein LWP59_33855 [Amycolatopsis acidiphila]|nr:hypothetical protein [Amycolatopsis acidiphila]UIJ59007.1 hypothetical protein LWP59_33855 [Amycolatopsis acidiphila]